MSDNVIHLEGLRPKLKFDKPPVSRWRVYLAWVFMLPVFSLLLALWLTFALLAMPLVLLGLVPKIRVIQLGRKLGRQE